MDAAFSIAKASVAGLIGAFSVDALVGKFNAVVSSMSALDDAAEMTGASVESLSSILNTLKPSGIGLDQITDVAGKLTRAMQGADEETGKAAKAFEALGIETRDTAGNLRPVDEVLKDLADSLSGYADGSNKVALVQAILGRGAAQFLPLLNDLAKTHKEAATVTTEQAAEAERLEKAFGKLGVGVDTLWQALASKLVPSLADLIDRFNKARAAGLGFIDSIYNANTPDELLGSSIEARAKKLEDLRKTLAREQKGFATAFGVQRDQAAIDRLTEQIAKEEALLRVQRLRKDTLDSLAQPDAALPVGAKREAPKISGESAGRTRATTESLSEGERYVRQLQEQILRTGELSEVERVLADVRQGRVKFDNAGQQQDALMLARRRDLLKEESEAEKARAKAAEESLKAENDALERLNQARQQQSDQLERQAQVYADLADPTAKYRRQLEEIAQLEGSGRLAPGLADLASIQVRRQMNDALDAGVEKQKESIDLAKDFGLTFNSAFEDAVFGAKKFSDALKGLLQDISRLIVRKTLIEPLIGNLLGSFAGMSAAGQARVTGLQDMAGAELAAMKSSTTAGPSIVQYITNQGGASPAEMAQFGENIKNATLRAVAERERR